MRCAVTVLVARSETFINVDQYGVHRCVRTLLLPDLNDFDPLPIRHRSCQTFA